KRIAGGEVGTLLILGGNPAYDAPADLDFASLIKRVPLSIRLGLHEDETSSLCTWHIPAAHYLESWGDAVAADGTMSPVQPMIDPLFGGITPLEMLARISAYDTAEPYEIVRRSFRRVAGATDFETKWRKFLHEGVFKPAAPQGPATAQPRELVQGRQNAPSLPSPGVPGAGAETAAKSGLEVCFSLSPSVFDGRFGNNAWMQECPDPITKLTWDNAALMSPKTATEHRVRSGEMVRIELSGRSIEIPVLVLPGHADGSVTLPLGYGRKVGAVADGAGCNVYALRGSEAMAFATGAKLSGTGRQYALVSTQEHWKISEHHLVESTLKQRAIIREATLEHYRKRPDFVRRMGVEVEKDRRGVPLSIYTPPALAGPHQWGMVIDLNKCIGCTACVVACQAENNIPVVGKDEVARGRAMHWIRLDRYYSGDPAGEVEVATQPMLCQQCENAPCEPVCPVNATVHSGEGLNQMIYNRCVGTRYCSNNCPYKVRRFNFFDYNKATLRQSAAAMRSGKHGPNPTAGWGQVQAMQPAPEEILKMQKNPQVTVRMRGVMEKCTYCVQRIEQAKIEAGGAQGQDPIAVEKGSGKNRTNSDPNGAPAVKVADGTIRTACEQACPTQAIVFGDISDPNSQISKLRKVTRNYEVLEHLNVRPRTTYLARLRNVNPAMPAPSLLDEQRPAEKEVEA
ncbi:MAG TPA: 4Fe-4S dicluster domain-containing protein, partial [Tepidisphaeraceae bacterium]|nr:4Fe-4S dicluster domain-containing protein [Tepidisphaeraceae bacterium]